MGNLLDQAEIGMVEMPDAEAGAERFDLRCRAIDLNTVTVRWQHREHRILTPECPPQALSAITEGTIESIRQ
jgi:hypothetical protein